MPKCHYKKDDSSNSCDKDCSKHKKEVIKGDLVVKGDLKVKGDIYSCSKGNLLPIGNTFNDCIRVNGNPALYCVVAGDQPTTITFEQSFILNNIGRTLHFSVPPTGNNNPVVINVVSPFRSVNNPSVITHTTTRVPPFNFNVYITICTSGVYVEVI